MNDTRAILHEINNQLSVIASSLELMAGHVGEDPARREEIGIAMAATTDIAALVRTLQAIAARNGGNERHEASEP